MKIDSGNIQEARITTKENKINKVELKRNYQNPENAFDKVRAMLKDGKTKENLIRSSKPKIIAIEEIEKHNKYWQTGTQ